MLYKDAVSRLRSLAEAGADASQLLAGIKTVKECGRKAKVDETEIEKFTTIYLNVKMLANDDDLDADQPAVFVRGALGTALTDKLEKLLKKIQKSKKDKKDKNEKEKKKVKGNEDAGPQYGNLQYQPGPYQYQSGFQFGPGRGRGYRRHVPFQPQNFQNFQRKPRECHVCHSPDHIMVNCPVVAQAKAHENPNRER